MDSAYLAPAITPMQVHGANQSPTNFNDHWDTAPPVW